MAIARKALFPLLLLATCLLGGCYSPYAYPPYAGGYYYGAYAAPVVVVGAPYRYRRYGW